MIQQFVDKFEASKDSLRQTFAQGHPGEYETIVKAVIGLLADVETPYGSPDPDRIHVIDDGDYQGTLVFVVAAGGYQPDRYWFVKVGYGSCSGCDTLQAIQHYSDEPPTEKQVDDYMTLALHIVQGLHEMNGDAA